MPGFGTNSSLNLALEDRLIRLKGEWIRVFKGSRCPCSGSEIGRNDFSCPNCLGTGHFYPTPFKWVCALITEVNLKRDPFGIPGYVIPGDLICSMRPLRGKLREIFDWDLIVLTYIDGIPVEGEDVIADPTGIDKLQEPIVKLESAFGIDSSNLTAVNFIVKYVPGIDFIVVPTSGNQLYPQSIQWLTSNRPLPGAKYTIRYTSQPQWIAFNPPTPHVERNVNFGQTIVLRKRSIVLASSLAGG